MQFLDIAFQNRYTDICLLYQPAFYPADNAIFAWCNLSAALSFIVLTHDRSGRLNNVASIT